ncbi:MAG: HAMP domain-containing histidine kinase [Bacteroidetes bacterium]|nr:HAMP domain-containing histidine kinase [Bacteroidota bacterium]
MDIFFLSNRRKIVSVIMLAGIAVASLLYTQFVMRNITEQERINVELWAKAIEYNNRQHNPESRAGLREVAATIEQHEGLNTAQRNRLLRYLERADTDLANEGLEFVANELIIKNLFEIPSIVTDSIGNILHYRNIDERQLSPDLVPQFAALNNPITITVFAIDGTPQYQYAYFGQSAVVQSLRFFPFVQFGLLTVFLGLLYMNLSNIRKTEQSNLWVGMAKEAAHQLGTPLSSMMGWVELLRSTTKEKEGIGIAMELEEDIRRLQNVADRFNKIGSSPELKPHRVEPVLINVTDYIEKRLPRIGKVVEIRRDIQSDVKIPLNPDLFSWAIENLLKNALDAIDSNHPEPYVKIRSFIEANELVIEVEDTGKGIERKRFREVFMPGYSTKKRGWGLGLSLTRRIIEEYHGGRISISHSAPGEGTTFRITLPGKENDIATV